MAFLLKTLWRDVFVLRYFFLFVKSTEEMRLKGDRGLKGDFQQGPAEGTQEVKSCELERLLTQEQHDSHAPLDAAGAQASAFAAAAAAASSASASEPPSQAQVAPAARARPPPPKRQM